MVTSIIIRTMNIAVSKVTVIARCLLTIAVEIIILSIMSARSANVSAGNRSNDFIKVAVFDGKSSFKDYLGQFELAAFANKWDKQTSAIELACSLRGSAAALLSDLTPGMKRDYDRLVKALTERFEPENQCELYKAQIKQRIRK